jgi:hypothetical protein
MDLIIDWHFVVLKQEWEFLQDIKLIRRFEVLMPMNAPLVRCDEVVWDFLGLSMATWNAILSLGLAAMWLASAVLPPNPYERD